LFSTIFGLFVLAQVGWYSQYRGPMPDIRIIERKDALGWKRYVLREGALVSISTNSLDVLGTVDVQAQLNQSVRPDRSGQNEQANAL